MRTFTPWEPLQDPHFESELDDLRAYNAKHGLTPDDLRECFDPEETLEYELMHLAEADALAVAEKVRAST